METEPLDEYHKQVDKGIFTPDPYDRLMIHYRKEKNYAEELKIIIKGIATFRKHYSDLQASTIKKQKRNIADLSRKISKSTGLVDKKGNDTYLPEPIPRWIKRQSVVELKLKKKK
ncbi:MAG TPA: hypothetical protein VM101_11185 [Flavitalea sp.]|nr:hypothetical protein [Flavitalea sp.]